MKRFLKVLLRIFIILIVVFVMVLAAGAGYFYYTRWEKDRQEIITYSGDKRIITSTKIELEPKVTGLFLGVNDNLTDFIMLGIYDPNTREVNLMSIPRDTKFDDTDRKINSVYAWYGGKPEKTVETVEKLTGVKVDYYVLFKTKVLRDLVDAVDGVTVNVPINMNYDDPYQNLYIHLKKGQQKLNGKQAEQFVRFRKNNDGTGYTRGDVDRIKAQQQFIKAMAARCLEPQNLVKAKQLINIVLDNTKTNVTQDVAYQYIDDAVAFKTDRIRMETLPGEGGYAANGISYFFVNKEEATKLIDELFNEETDIEEVKELMQKEEEESGSKPVIRTALSGDKVNIEVLNNGASANDFNKAVKILNDAGYSVVRVGNIEDSNDASRIISYVTSEEALEIHNKLSEIVGIKKLESSASTNEGIDFTVILGSKYIAE